MRTRKDIEDNLIASKETFSFKEAATLEVLLDIRDLLAAKNNNTHM
jgi:hypothetical protein